MNRVLVIEFDEFFNNNLVELLQLEGFKAIGVTNMREAEIAIQKLKPSVILCDEISLKGKFAKLGEILKRALKYASIILMNTDGTTDNFKSASFCLKMPFTDEELFSKLDLLTGKGNA